MKTEVVKKRGGQSLPRDPERIKSIKIRMERINMQPNELYKSNKEFFSRPNLYAKLRGDVGCTENEFSLIEKTISRSERKIISSLKNME